MPSESRVAIQPPSYVYTQGRGKNVRRENLKRKKTPVDHDIIYTVDVHDGNITLVQNVRPNNYCFQTPPKTEKPNHVTRRPTIARARAIIRFRGQ